MVTITIPYNEIDFKKVTDTGLEWMMEILLAQEWYEKCIEVRDEIRKRKKEKGERK